MTKLPQYKDEKTPEIAHKVRDRRDRAPNVSIEMVDNAARLTIGESSEPEEHLRLMDALGTYDIDFLSPLLGQIGNAVSANGELRQDSLQFAVSFIKSIKPESELEAMLAAQMAATHICALDASRRLLSSSTLPGKDSAERAMTKLTRAFTTQMEALKKHRAKAQQIVRVERVNVESGGQAIVGDVSAGGGGFNVKSDGNPIDPTQRLRDAPRCSAKAKSTGQRWKAPAVRGRRVCRVHGAGGGAPRGKAHPNYKHGLRIKEMDVLRKLTSLLGRDAKSF
jgi:hypothetical protein